MILNRKVAIVTGAGRGIGRKIVHRLSEEGALVTVADLDKKNAATVSEEIHRQGGTALAVGMDICNENQIESMIETTIESFGSLDILVNNAGLGLTKSFMETTRSEWQRQLDVNLTGTFLCSQAAARRMIQKGSGKIVNIASISGQRGGWGRAAYGAAKAGVILLTKVMALELIQKGINVNAVSPGPIDTAMSRECHDDATRKAYHRLIPANRYGEEHEIADAVVFLASEESSWIVGHTLNVDGGFQAAGLLVSEQSRYG
jgi:NAD(P)-dependent dehydrogenase (short-subunit alcohol dehydrogenase family)